MAISFNSADSGSVATDPLTFSATVASGSNKVMIVGTNVEYSAATASTVASITYDGNSLTNIDRQLYGADKSYVELWYLATDASITEGANNVVVTMTTDTNLSRIHAATIVINGAAQQAPEASGKGTGTSTAASASITTQTNNAWIIDVVGNPAAGTDQTAQAAQTERWEEVTTQRSNGSTKPFVTAGATTMSWTIASTKPWGVVCAAFEEEGVAVTFIPKVIMIQ